MMINWQESESLGGIQDFMIQKVRILGSILHDLFINIRMFREKAIKFTQMN